jgi:signal transduction histidine kinase
MFADVGIMTWVGLGAVFIAFAAVMFALRLSMREGAAASRWKNKATELDRRLGSYDAIMGAYPGLILVWEENTVAAETGWGDPKVLGSPAALASIMRFADPGPSNQLAMRVLDGLADLNTISERADSQPLRIYIRNLRTKGESFSISIVLPEGNIIEADGRVAGRQVVLWLEDASIRGEDEKAAISRFENSRITSETDPIAFIEMMSRAPFPLWRMNSSGRINWVNEAYVDAVGASDVRDVTVNQIHLDHQASEDAHTALSEQVEREATRNIVLGGERRATSISLFPINGGLAGIALDANEAEDLRQRLQQQVAAHDKLLNSMDEAVVVFGSDKKASFENEAFRHMFGLDEAWSRDRPSHGEWLDHMRERGQVPAQPDHGAWKAEELNLYTEWPKEMTPDLWHLQDGRTLRLIRMRDPQGGITLMFSDMTDRIDLEGRLGTLINVQRATLDKLSEGIAVFGTDGRLKIHNNAFARMWSLSEEDLKDSPRFSALIDLCLPLYHDRQFWSDLKARATDSNPEVRRQVEGEIRRSDDKMLTWLSKPLPDGATLVAWDDVTSARRTEAALIERAEALEEADRMKSEFVGHVSYQLRTPLTTISGYADFLQNGGAGEMNDKQSEYVFAIQSASEDLAKIIDDILDIAAIEANVLDLDLGDVDIYDVLSHALDYVATKAEDTKMSMELDCDPDIGIIRADETRIKQVVYNLLSNALRFTKPGGLILLGGKRAPGGGVQIWVKDDGVGIPSEKQSQVFESFQSSRGGAGLGLALVQRFVECHGGWVELESDEGLGTHVTCYLPKEAAVDAGHPELFDS